ncbi:MAG: oligosaccharide flippase family protein [Cyclobacteriaceae bacterium]
MSVLNKAKRAGKIQFIAILISKGIGVIFTVLLARILFPEDYGNLTVALIFTGFLTIFSNFGFQTFLIQNNNDDPGIPHTTFFLELAFSGLVIIILLSCSFLAQYHFGNEVVGNMLRLYCINILVISIGHTPLALFKRNLDFDISSGSEVAYTISSNIFRVVFALSGFGALCFPIGDILGNILKTGMIYWRSAFRPQWKFFEKSKVKEILRFGGYTSLTSIGAYMANQIDKVLVASVFPIKQVGFYNFGYAQSGLYFNLIQASQTSVLLSLFAKFRDNLPEARRVLMNVTRLVNFLALPVYGYAILEAELIVKVIFSEKWLGAVPYFQIFAADFLFRSFFTGITGIQLAFGLAKSAARTKLINSVLFVLLLLIASGFNKPEYYAWFYFLATVVSTMHNVVVNGKLLELKYGSYARNFIPNMITIALTLIGYYTVFSMIRIDDDMVKLLTSGLFFSAFYFFSTLLFNRSMLLQVWRIILPDTLKKA